MSDALKLTAYFGERLRTGDGFVADALLDLYGSAGVATSVMLRGIAGFGGHRQLRTDEQLSLSEDPSVAVAAVDTADKIAALAEQAVSMTTRGLVTLERAQLGGTATPPEDAKLTVYVGRQHRISGRPAHIAVCDVLYRHGFAGATVFLGVDGTVHGRRCRARFFSRNADVPVMIVAVGNGPQVAAAIDELFSLLVRPLLTVERVALCKRDGRLLARPPTDGSAPWQKLMIHTSEAARHDGAPIHRAIVRRLRESGASGATVLRGIWGFQGDGAPHGDKLIQLGRQVPVTTILVDTPERIAAAFDIVDELTGRHGLLTSEWIPTAHWS
ncbi:DUF190 domain-containing protein [Mycobacterium hubeiense]|uniref:DUF190 domain-containing protein n=1 Tax=Mycobacterium hubeiense TaxID=1867256 RepID=UPI000C7E8969|nr:DUF190 domain-containing protein [Mycobacterium sp. QGD 101]